MGNIKETFPPKTDMQKKVVQDPGYVDTVETCCTALNSNVYSNTTYSN